MAGAGALRAYRGVNETISTLLLNYIAIALLNHIVEGPLRDPSSLNKPSTLPIGDDNMLGNLPGLDVHWGLGFGLIACLIAWFLMQRTTFGFAARMVGGNVRAALLNGLPVRRLIVVATFLGGLGAGLAGAVEVAAIHGNANASLVTGYGYTGVLVAFIARANPFGVIPVALLAGRYRRQRRASAAGVRAARTRPSTCCRGSSSSRFCSRIRSTAGAGASRSRRWRRERGRRRRTGDGRRRDPHQHALPLRQPGRVPDREERAREPRSRRDAGHGRDGRLRRLVPDQLALARRAGRRRAAASCWGRCTPGSAPGRASTTSRSGSR